MFDDLPLPAASTHIVLPMQCPACAGLVRLEIRHQIPESTLHVWTCPACRTDHALRARWRVVKVLQREH